MNGNQGSRSWWRPAPQSDQTGVGDGKILKRRPHLLMAEIRPILGSKIELRIGKLPEKEVADALLTASTDKQIRHGPITKAQIALEHRFCNVIGAKITGFNFRTNLPSGLGYVPLPP